MFLCLCFLWDALVAVHCTNAAITQPLLTVTLIQRQSGSVMKPSALRLQRKVTRLMLTLHIAVLLPRVIKHYHIDELNGGGCESH